MKLILLMAATIDGKIARSSDEFPDWTGRADKKFFAEISKKSGAIIFGKKTFDAIGRPLPHRKNIVLTRQKIPSQKNLIFTAEPPQKILENLKNENFRTAILAGGAQINSLFARENLIDEIWLTICPLIFGRGISLFSDEIFLNLQFLKFEKIDENSILLKYKILKKNQQKF